MAARLTRLLVVLVLLLGAALPSAAAADVRLPTSQEIAPSPVRARGAYPANASSYFGARYYRAEIGRFTTIDPVITLKENLGDPQRWNRYVYARNNPLRFTDPDGKIPVLLIAGLVFAASAALNAPSHDDVRRGALADDDTYRNLGEAAATEVVVGPISKAVTQGLERLTAWIRGPAVEAIGPGTGIGPGAAHTSEFMSSNAARREAMRQAGIPTSAKPVSQISTPAGRQYIYEVNGQRYAVTQQTTDRVAGHGPHWEVGKAKPVPGYGVDPLGRTRVFNDGKVKVSYGQ